MVVNIIYILNHFYLFAFNDIINLIVSNLFEFKIILKLLQMHTHAYSMKYNYESIWIKHNLRGQLKYS